MSSGGITIKIAGTLLLSSTTRQLASALGDQSRDSNTFRNDGKVPLHPHARSMEQQFPETETLAYYTDTESEEFEPTSPSIVTSSLLFEGGSVVSMHALLSCHGGAEFEVQTLDVESEYESDESDDEDDNDDDDGHSLILSNVSVRKNRAFSNDASSFGSGRDATRAARSTSSCRSRSFGGCQAALSLRGGAATTGSEFGKRLIVAAIVTLMYEAVLGHFLEFVKIVMQTSPQGTTYGDVIKSITDQKGIAGIWDGFIPWGIVQSLAKGSVFGLAHSIATSVLLPLVSDNTLPEVVALTLAGGIAGGFQGYVLSPTLLLKTRVMTNPVFREQMSMLRTTWLSFKIGGEVVAQEGLGALMKGSSVFATKRVFDWATRFYFSDVFEGLIRRQKGVSALGAGDKILASLLGGTASTFSTLPLDVLVAKTQDAKKAGVQVSAFALFKADLKEKGWSGLYDSYMRGFEARILHVCFTTAVMKVGSPLLYDAMFKKSPLPEM